MEPYILLSPLGDTRVYATEEFFKHVGNFIYKPAEIVVCVEPKVESELNRLGITEITKLLGNLRLRAGYLPRIAYARERLREYFLNTSLDWALWLDSDILAPPELPEKLLQVADEKNSILICNKYPGRGEEKWSGSGCILTHRIACDIGRFMVVSLDVGDIRKNICEDYNFFSLVTGAASIIKRYTGKEGRVTGEFVTVKHWINRDEIR